MVLKVVVLSSLLLLLQVLQITDSLEIDDETIDTLLRHIPEIPAIPTKNGYYVFVPSAPYKSTNNNSPEQSKKDTTQPQNTNFNMSQNTQLSTSPNNSPIQYQNFKSNQSPNVKFSISQMRGVNRAGLEYSCVKNFGIFDGPNDEPSIQAIKNWNVNIVRIPLNEDCWLGINGINSAFSGENYRSAVINYIQLLRKNGLSVIISLHWSDGYYSGPGAECNEYTAKCQKPMPDAENAPKFWLSVANQFKNNDNIIFDLFNNPSPDKVIQDQNTAWKCWKSGGDYCPGFQYRVAGMQDLVNAVRETGALNPVMIGGLRFANDLSKWQENVPHDQEGKIIASWHSFKEDKCNYEKCWETEIAEIAKNYPIIVGEIGQKDCSTSYIDKLMDWLDKKQISYLGWTWNTWDCSTGPSLISDYSGTPTNFGKGLLQHLTAKGKNNQISNKSYPGNSFTIESKPTTESIGSLSSIVGPSSDKNYNKRQLRGVNRSGAEYSCVKNLGIFEGPVDDNAIQSMKKWNINAVRVPLNEDCWLGINGHTPAYSGSNYRNAVINYVNLLRKNDISVILDLHWSDGIYGGPGQGECYDKSARCQKPMPDKENAPKFWKSVSTQFKNDEGIIFDLFNEPFPEMVVNDRTAAWKCWRDGGSACSGFQYEVAGMTDLLNAVRSTGATNQVMIGGLCWANDLSRWQEFVPSDPANNIAASWHSYDFNACNNKDCWESQIAPLAAKYPVIVGEIGEHGCCHKYIDGLMDWLETKNISFLGWTWNTWDCSSGPSLISDYNGTPTAFGQGIQDRFCNSA